MRGGASHKLSKGAQGGCRPAEPLGIVMFQLASDNESHKTQNVVTSTVGEWVKIDLGFHEGAWILTSPRSSPLADLATFLILENGPGPYGSVLSQYELISSHMDLF